MITRPMDRFALLCLVLIGLCAPLHARSRFEGVSNEEMLRRSLAALASPDNSDDGVKAKAQALSDLAELRYPPPNAEALAVDVLRGPSGYRLAPFAGRLLLRLGADKWQAIASLMATGKISDSRGEAVLKPFVEANEARDDWEKGTGLKRSTAFSALLQLRAVTHDEFLKAIADKDANVRSAAPLVAGFLDLTNDDWQTIAALLRDPDPQVRQSAMRALMEDSAPNPSQFDSAVFALRYDAALSSNVLSWFDHAELSQDQIDQLAEDLRTRPDAEQRLALNLLGSSATTHPEKLLPAMVVLASAPDNPSIAAQGFISILQTIVDRLCRDSLGKPELEQQLLARLTPLLRNRSIARPAHGILLAAVAKLKIDTSDLSDIFIRDFALAKGSSLSLEQQCLDHAGKANKTRFAQVIWQAQHDPDARVAQAARRYAADRRLSGVWMLALKEGSSAEKHEALDTFEEYGIGPDGWPALADCMNNPEAALRAKALRALIHTAMLQEHVDADGRAFLRDLILAALNDPDANVQRLALAHAGSEFVCGRPEVRDAVIAHLNHPNADLQATAWNALATGLPSGIFGDIRQACPTIDDILKEAIWYGKPGIRDSAIRNWDVLHPGAPLPWPPQQIMLLVTLIILWPVLAGLQHWASLRESKVWFDDLTPTDDEQEAEYATKAMGFSIIAATVVVALPLLWAIAARLIVLPYGLLCGLSLVTYILAGAAAMRWGKLIRTGRLLDRLVALALVSLVTISSLFMCAVAIAAAFTSQDSLPVPMLLSQVVTVTAVFGIGVSAIRRIVQTFRTPTFPQSPEGFGKAGSQDMRL